MDLTSDKDHKQSLNEIKKTRPEQLKPVPHDSVGLTIGKNFSTPSKLQIFDQLSAYDHADKNEQIE